MIDLDELGALVNALSSLPWKSGDRALRDDTVVDDAGQLVMYAGGADGDEQLVMSDHDRAGMLALVNAAPELLRLARVGQNTSASESVDPHKENAKLRLKLSAACDFLEEAQSRGEGLREGYYCQGCKKEIDPDCCGCGSGRDQEHDNHHFIPLGCDCFRAK